MTPLLLAIALGVLTAGGLYLMLRPRTFDLVLGLTLLSYAVNLFIFFMGRLAVGLPPIVDGQRAPTLAHHADPLPQALVLTAIVISFAMTAVLLVIALRARAATGTDHADGQEVREEFAPHVGPHVGPQLGPQLGPPREGADSPPRPRDALPREAAP
jgi:multicomponent K+:H+ antiporter subunit C